jgi:hypothetical protein
MSNGLNCSISLDTTYRDGSVLTPTRGEENATFRAVTKFPVLLIHTTDLFRSTPSHTSTERREIEVWWGKGILNKER